MNEKITSAFRVFADGLIGYESVGFGDDMFVEWEGNELTRIEAQAFHAGYTAALASLDAEKVDYDSLAIAKLIALNDGEFEDDARIIDQFAETYHQRKLAKDIPGDQTVEKISGLLVDTICDIFDIGPFNNKEYREIARSIIMKNIQLCSENYYQRRLTEKKECEFVHSNKYDGMMHPGCINTRVLNFGFKYCPYCGKPIHIKEPK